MCPDDKARAIEGVEGVQCLEHGAVHEAPDGVVNETRLAGLILRIAASCGSHERTSIATSKSECRSATFSSDDFDACIAHRGFRSAIAK